nr:aromatase/cyclase [Kibdelosporangium sp. MJ126-NF4]CEL20584.1 Aromatase [Kibdelosporangium sp. MJ126-NF4]CTQ89495.1 Aromatase [Kibdelosporangium sp. MJ126-NF4]
MTREVEHEIEVRAPAKVVYGLVADVASWPQIFPPSVHVEHLERGERHERIQIWATANGEAKTWTSRRELDPDALRVDFRQEVSQPPVASMGGAWIVEPTSDESSRVRLLHDYRAVDDDKAKLAWIDEAVDRNSHSELAAMKANAERAVGSAESLLTFDDTVRINAPAKAVYDFLNEAQLWEKRLPHVAKVSMVEKTPGLQWLEMDTMTKDGSVHTTKSVRVCLPPHKIVYKQVVLPALMNLHTGHWSLTPDGDGVSVTSRHTVVINESNIAGILGANATIQDALRFVRTALSTNSLATLGHAKDHVES